ncbi:hypothetical protein L596_027609 [Steinernema carpocapsae]|uniref:CB1 cannabinoid receptor-interacting protein 1 n=1 Tax=Steinernema carpocapsae TaxID=34508 RepID=A0A4U5LW26_STECR|nr:hypothetical protein L596_027609 [Steinernema carpocapsae]
MFPTTVFVFCLAGIVFGAIENPAGGEVQPSSFSHSSSFQGNFVSNNGSRHSNYQFINGNCHVSNGVVDDNGSQRPLTDNEKQQIEQYEKDMEQYGVDFAKSMQQWTQNMMRQMFDSFGASFPFGNREELAKPAAPVQPIMPIRVPCFCQSCKQNTTETVLPASAGKNADE